MSTVKSKRNYVTIVSGLPRSGTSLAMSAIAAGGIDPLIDHVRQADEDNPKGYFEFEQVKKIKQHTGWLSNAEGQVVKMVYRLLYDLPDSYQYRVVFMRRHLSEILASQTKMLERTGLLTSPTADTRMRQLFTTELYRCHAWLEKQPNFKVLYINHRDIIHDSTHQMDKISAFLDSGLNVDAMVNIVDPRLYRNRA
jgi:hypothetical protein